MVTFWHDEVKIWDLSSSTLAKWCHSCSSSSSYWMWKVSKKPPRKLCFLPCWFGFLVGLWAGLHKNYWIDFLETWMEEWSQPRIQPINFWCSSRLSYESGGLGGGICSTGCHFLQIGNRIKLGNKNYHKNSTYIITIINRFRTLFSKKWTCDLLMVKHTVITIRSTNKEIIDKSFVIRCKGSKLYNPCSNNVYRWATQYLLTIYKNIICNFTVTSV